MDDRDDAAPSAAQAAELTALAGALSRARSHDRAPDALRARIAADHAAHAGAGRRHRAGILGGGLATGLAAVAVILIIVLSGGSGSLSLLRTVALAQRGPAGAAGRVEPADPARLVTHVGRVYFPAQLAALRATGERTDTVAGRRVITVYYGATGGRQVAYSVVDSPPLAAWGAAAASATPGSYAALRLGGREVLTWREAGHTCVLSSTRLSGRALRALVVSV